MCALVFRLNSDKRRGHAIFANFFRRNRPAWNLQTLQAGADQSKVAAGVDECAERHVAADPAEAIEVSNFHQSSQTTTASSLLILSAAENSVKLRGKRSDAGAPF